MIIAIYGYPGLGMKYDYMLKQLHGDRKLRNTGTGNQPPRIIVDRDFLRRRSPAVPRHVIPTERGGGVIIGHIPTEPCSHKPHDTVSGTLAGLQLGDFQSCQGWSEERDDFENIGPDDEIDLIPPEGEGRPDGPPLDRDEMVYFDPDDIDL